MLSFSFYCYFSSFPEASVIEKKLQRLYNVRLSIPLILSTNLYKLAEPVAERTTTVAAGVAWACQGTTCVARKGSSRPLRMCRELQREHGEITAFVADEKALDADKLAQCNR